MVKTGVAFPDYITTEKQRKIRNFDSKNNSSRDFFLFSCLVLGLGVIFFKLIFLQILQGSYYRGLSNNNRIKTIVVHAPRGAIFDRNGKPLVFNVPGFRKTVNGKNVIIGKTDSIPILAGGEKDLEYDSVRQYPFKEDFAHVLGYTGQISQDELKNSNFSGYSGGDIIGKMGVEQYFESSLKGTDGKQLIEVDSLGNTIRKLRFTDPIPGQNVTLNLDLNLQKAAYEAMSNVKRGAVVVSTPKGEILTILSKPSFDPNLFTLPLNYQQSTRSASFDSAQDKSSGQAEAAQTQLQSILFDSDRPLLDRAISGTYPPGSTFKLVVAAAGLQNGVIDENYTVNDTGVINLGAFSFSNWYFSQYGKTEGSVNVVKGIKRSTDTFFYKLAEEVGVDKISEMAKKFGLGGTLGIDLFGEAGGLVPTPGWKEKAIGEPWYLGDTYHYGIGQGYLLTTPIQVNGWTQAIANDGILYEPHLLKSQNSKVKTQKFLSDKTIGLVKEGMVESCSTGGVAWPLFEFKIKNSKLRIDGKNFLAVPEATTSASFGDFRKVTVACKTGTAQHGNETSVPHAWITLFAPAYNPQVVVTVLAEESGEGSNVAAPIAKKILEKWLSW